MQKPKVALYKMNKPPPHLVFTKVAGAYTNCCVLLAPKRCTFMLVWPVAAIRCNLAGSYQLPTMTQMRNVVIRSRPNDEFVADFSANLFIIR